MNDRQLTPEIQAQRQTEFPIHPLIQNRWSPRSLTGEELTDAELMPLFEAAKWAPSSYNSQPWRFLYAKRNTPSWNTFFNLLSTFNQSWAKEAAVLVVVVSRKNLEHNEKPSETHSFDAGAAWMSLALEATSRGLVAHGMQGFDYQKAGADLGIPDSFQVEAMIAIGKPAPKEKLSPDLQKKEVPGARRPLQETIMEGSFKK